jgi:hypothetical protein
MRQPLHIVRDPYTLATGLACCGDVRIDGESRVPLACDITVEADSGGHTDNRPLSVLLPASRQLWALLHSQGPVVCDRNRRQTG